MKNPNSSINKIKKSLFDRWQAEDYPGGEKRFQVILFIKDFACFILLPLFSIIIFKSCESVMSKPKKMTANNLQRRTDYSNEQKSQIIDYSQSQRKSQFSYARKAPGTLIRVRLLNNVETYSIAPVYAQVINSSLGKNLYGGILIGEASPDTNVGRININFKFAKDPKKENLAVGISARALSLDGTYGIIAKKKGNLFSRSVLTSMSHVSPQKDSESNAQDMLLRALQSGFIEESNSDLQVKKNQLQVLRLESGAEFLAELTDFFPGNTR